MNAEVLDELFRGLSQQGPGNDACTLRALAAVGALPKNPRTLDLGCGTGRQTLVLAQHCGGNVLAVDLDPNSLAQVDRRASHAKLQDHIETQVGSIAELGFRDQSFDLIWSEGAIYNIGFERGFSSWRRLLSPGACIAVTELSWLTPDPPQEAREFWQRDYPAMASREQNIEVIRRANYELVDHFALPDTAWWDFYDPLEARIAELRDKHASPDDASGALATLASVQREIDVFRTRAGSYSYVFYIAQRPREERSG